MYLDDILIPSVNHRVEWTADLRLPDWNVAETFVATSAWTNWSEAVTAPRCYGVKTVP